MLTLKNTVGLTSSFGEYFPEDVANENWIIDSSSVGENTVPDDFFTREREELGELSCDGGLRLEFRKVHLSDFWLWRREEYPLISDRAMKFVIPF